MQISKNTSKISVGILIFLMMASIAAIAMPSVKAQVQSFPDTTYPASSGYPILGPLPAGVTPQYTFQQVAYISVQPTTVGLNQQMLINIWTSPGMYHTFYGQGFTVDIIKPDGTTEKLGPVNSYSGDDTFWWTYNANQVGTWQFKFSAPGTYLPVGNYTDSPTGQAFGGAAGARYYLGASVWYTPCETSWYNVTVQQDFVSSWPPAALPGPGDYWTRPGNPMNREWWSILGNYPFSGIVFYSNGHELFNGNYKYTPYVQAPNSCHVVWKRANALSGLIGGTAYTSTVFSSPGNPSIIYDGRCYQTLTKIMPVLINGTYLNQPTSVWECYDLRTGEVYWDQTGIPAPPTNIIYELGTSQPVPGAEANNGYTVTLLYLGGSPTRMIQYNPFTGAPTLNITLPEANITSSYLYGDPYCVSLQTLRSGGVTIYRLLNWTIQGWSATTTFASKLISNISWPTATLPGAGADWDYGITGSGSWNTPPGPQWCIGYAMTSYDIRTGALLANISSNDTLTYNMQGTSFQMKNGMMALDAQQGHWNAWNSRTGALVWTSSPASITSQDPWGNWWAYYTSSYDINETCSEIIACAYNGLWAFNWADGKVLWHYFDNNTVPFETPYGGNSFFTGNVMADDKVYAYAGEHTPSEPINRGWDTICLNATTGELIWHIENTMVPGAIADGYMTMANQDDGYMYVFGIGKSSTTVSAPQNSVPQGTPVLIQGTVLDQSPAQPGTPCVADGASMSTQMQYIHMQQPIDGKFHNEAMTGVPVILTAIDSSGSVYDIGTTTSNAYYGNYGMSWTPPKADTYTILATFAGSNSYGSSTAGTQLLVTTAPVASATPTSTIVPTNYATPSDVMTYIAVGVVAIIIAIAIVGVLLLRKK